MLDKEYRTKALQWMKESKFYEHKSLKQKECFDQAIECYLKIKIVLADDRRKLSELYWICAIADFNKGHKQDAAVHYQRSIEQLLEIKLEERQDRDYRELTELFLDLADTCYYLPNQQAAEEARENAIQAFFYIKNKNTKEQAIGDPTINFSVFYEYFQNITSEKSYIASAKFKNHAHILQTSHAKHQEDESMANLFGTCCIDEMSGIDAMMGELTVTNISTHNFVPIRLNEPSDVDYRTLAIEFLGLTQSHIQQNEIINTIKTYGQALHALNTIQIKTESDQQIISAIEQQICFLNKKIDDVGGEYDEDDLDDSIQASSNSQPLPEQNEQISSLLINNIRMTMFGRRPQGISGIEFEEEPAYNPSTKGNMDYA